MELTNVTSWNDRFALIDHFNPSTEAVCKVFGVSEKDYSMAVKLRQAGTFQPSNRINPTVYERVFLEVNTNQEESNIPTNSFEKIGTATIHTRPETATKKSLTKPPQKRGRKGNKITMALLAVTETPVLVDEFIKQHDVSVQVLRQAKRFIANLTEEEQLQVGKVCVKQDPTTKQLMIWKENV